MFICIRSCNFIRICIYMRVITWISTFTCTCICIHMLCARLYLYVHACLYVYAYLHVNVRVNALAYVNVYACGFACVSISDVHTNINSGGA